MLHYYYIISHAREGYSLNIYDNFEFEFNDFFTIYTGFFMIILLWIEKEYFINKILYELIYKSK
jgi:hypothetical protein